jgi:hypothetical protein
MKNIKPDIIRKKVLNFKTKYKEGFTKKELKLLIKDFPNLNMNKFDNALMGITCMVKGKQIIIYHCDIIKALYCGIENRNLKFLEWD